MVALSSTIALTLLATTLGWQQDGPGVPRSTRPPLQTIVAVTYLSTLALAAPFVLQANDRDSKRESQLRNALFASIPARCNILEIGFGGGAGANLAYYPIHAGLTVTAVDPAFESGVEEDKGARGQYAARGITLRTLPGRAESLPFRDAEFDCVVGTLVLCSVSDPTRVLSEVARVLKPQGSYLSVEHVLSDAEPLQSTQRLLDPLQQAVAHNCHLARQTDQLFANEARVLGLCVRELTRHSFASQFPISSQVYSRLERV